ncbi:Alpha/Beta hydrolase protein [Paraphoma chrysanthemicola]|uniref:Alpha/Beta hydrolase protein n=1 Tax=Paraphoma chrysanthemicola TaxID=798071 RepID=A0A8K0REA6_9PLEO|nr:Alpha/Beta hydrolase protein [Paraphoma chrysanthemicola]
MASVSPQDLPLDDRSDALKIPIVTLITFSSIFVVLRLGVSIRNRNFFLLTDHFLWTGHVLAIAGAIACYKMAEYGGGRHIYDPIFQNMDNLKKYMYYLWVGQLLNLYGMALVKLSICAYIFMLNFSKGFRILIWVSVVIHIGLNFVFPTIILFGECTPYSKHWDVTGQQSGSCWSTKPKVISGYAGAATNILTDLIYTIAPLVYISRVQLNKRTIWGVRVVFLLGLITTTISALKLYEMKALNDSPDPTYTSVNLSIYAIAEVFVGVFTACLPPLRKTFDDILRRILPAGMVSSRGTSDSYALHKLSNRSTNITKESKVKHESDGDSDYAILEETQPGNQGSVDEILKTTEVSPIMPIPILEKLFNRFRILAKIHLRIGFRLCFELAQGRNMRHNKPPYTYPINHHMQAQPPSQDNCATMSKPSQPFPLDLQFRGHIEGLTYLSPSSKPLCHFFGGVPFALPPVGPFRFQKPRPLPTCYRYGTKVNPARFTGGTGLCPQQTRTDVDADAWDEDCLQSNVWVPVGEAPTGGWPVLVWIHGGFLQFGNPNDLDFRAFLDESISKCIIVAPAYRLNLFGFLASSALSSSCADVATNVGFWDQRMALQWTFENINYFGGNASNITLAGYSAGAHSVFHQLAYDLGVPDNKAIIKRAMMLSNGPGMQPKSLDEAQHQYEEFITALGISTTLPPSEQLKHLRAKSAKDLIAATNTVKFHQFRAVTDGTFVRPTLLNEISNGTFARLMRRRGVKLMLGECSDEHFVYGTWRPPQSGYANMFHRLEADYSHNAVKVLMDHYFPTGKLGAKFKTWQEAFGHIYADVQVHALERGMVDALIRHGVGDLVYRYRIEWRAECVVNKFPKNWGVTHTADMPMWFWGNGWVLSEVEKDIVRKGVHEPLKKFLVGEEEVGWGTKGLQIRTLKADGRVEIEEDGRLDAGLELWGRLKRVGALGQGAERAKL